jgi:hypothetical protein
MERSSEVAYCEVTDFACYVPHNRPYGTLVRAEYTTEHLAGRGALAGLLHVFANWLRNA